MGVAAARQLSSAEPATAATPLQHGRECSAAGGTAAALVWQQQVPLHAAVAELALPWMPWSLSLSLVRQRDAAKRWRYTLVLRRRLCRLLVLGLLCRRREQLVVLLVKCSAWAHSAAALASVGALLPRLRRNPERVLSSSGGCALNDSARGPCCVDLGSRQRCGCGGCSLLGRRVAVPLGCCSASRPAV